MDSWACQCKNGSKQQPADPVSLSNLVLTSNMLDCIINMKNVCIVFLVLHCTIIIVLY